MKAKNDLGGVRFGKLTAVHIERISNGNAMWKCECDCGETAIVERCNLTSGVTKSCGCLRVANLETHSLSSHPLYSIWCNMKARCNDKRNPGYKNYGGRGITICDAWENDFTSFYDYMTSIGWEPSKDIDRRNNDWNYCPENIKMSTRAENAQNRRSNKLNKYRVKRIREFISAGVSIADIAKSMSVHITTVYNVHNGLTWSNI